jgi:restriction system protein
VSAGSTDRNSLDDVLHEKLVFGNNYSLKDWLDILQEHDEDVQPVPDYCFPTKGHRLEYLASIDKRSDDEVRMLLRHFLVKSGRFGGDDYAQDALLKAIHENPSKIKAMMKSEYYQKLIFTGAPWEGVTWVLDLLLYSPSEAIAALRSYLIANFGFLPDWSIDGLLDAIAIIRAKYLDRQRPQSELLALTPSQFESLVAILYKRMGYKVVPGRGTKDGGHDIDAFRTRPGFHERIIIQCKRYTKNVGVKAVREHLGVVDDAKASKGVMVATSEFTKSARKFAEDNPRLELVGGKVFQKLLNAHGRLRWTDYLDDKIADDSRDSTFENELADQKGNRPRDSVQPG